MTRRPRHRGERIGGLFGFADGAPTEQLDEVPDNPRLRECGWCGAHIGDPCTRRGRGGTRIPLATYHDTRLHPTTEETP